MKSIEIVSLKCYNKNGDDMERREAKEITLDLLLGDQNINADFYASLFNKYRCGDSENTPISPAGMQTVNERNNILLTEETFKDLDKIRDITRRTNQEIAYFIFGEEKPDGTVLLDTVISTYRPSGRTSASFDDLVDSLGKYVRGVETGKYSNGSKPIVCHGHTHGLTAVSDNFSFGDLISYVQFNSAHPLFKNRQIETMAMLMPPCGDYNFIMYENNPVYEGFYIFPTVNLQYENGLVERLPAYQKGDYLVNSRFTTR